MAETSAIEWTDSTISFWWGCRKVGPGCDHCYAEALAKRFGIPDYESSGVRRRISGAIGLIRKLQRTADKFEAKNGRRRRVFIQSMSDFFDNEVPADWRAEAWAEIVAADRLEIQIVTKRIPNVRKMMKALGCTTWPAHVGLIDTVVNQEEADRDIWRLLTWKKDFGVPWVGLSIEPMLGPIDLWNVKIPGSDHRTLQAVNGLDSKGVAHFEGGIDWVIVGGESGSNARPMNPEWVIAIRDACDAVGVPFLFKQWGEWQPILSSPRPMTVVMHGRTFMGRSIHTFEDGQVSVKVGKSNAGRLLHGVTHDGFPRIAA